MISLEEIRNSCVANMAVKVADPKRFIRTFNNIQSKTNINVMDMSNGKRIFHDGAILPRGFSFSVVIDANEDDGDGYRGVAINAPMPVLNNDFFESVQKTSRRFVKGSVVQMQEAAAKALLAVSKGELEPSEEELKGLAEHLMDSMLHRLARMDDFRWVWNESANEGPALALCTVITGTKMATGVVPLGEAMPDEMIRALSGEGEATCLQR